MLKILCFVSLIGAIIGQRQFAEFSIKNSNIKLQVINDECNEVKYSIWRGSTIIQEVNLGHNTPFTTLANSNTKIVLSNNEEKIEFSLLIDSEKFTLFEIARTSLLDGYSVSDCINLNTTKNSHWYGGPQQKYQYWPIEKLTLHNYSYVTKEADNAAIAERYWLNSDGVFFYVNEEAPLFIDQNSREFGYLCLDVRKELPYDTYSNTFNFRYAVGVAENAKQAHIEAIDVVFDKPTDVPDRIMAALPIWSTWARYKRDIDENILLEFADEIIDNGFKNSQFEIDDDWEDCYGALTFNKTKFKNITETVKDLKAKGFRVTLWIHPFINKGCEPWYSEALSNGYLVLDHKGSPDTEWWNSAKGQAAYIDFTKIDAADWFSSRLARLQNEHGIDSFKFDAGETSWTPPDPALNAHPVHHPTAITTDYIRTVGKFGPIVEVRSGARTQDLPIYLRMIDKDSEWTWNNGLPTLVTTILQLNMAGYTFILPDMIGGNGYNDHPPNSEVFLRWLQANVFMPSLQFSYVPWDYDDEIIELSRNFTELHESYIDLIMERFQMSVDHGYPVNPPLWWVDPMDKTAQAIFDQFLLGDDIISAPVLEENKVSRDIYLPKGNWIDGNSQEVHPGPKWLRSYSAPLNILPYFIRQK